MSNARTLALLAAFGALPWLPAMAQQPSNGGANPPGVVATTNNPNLAVANVKLENGVRVSKIIGMTVYTDANEKVGTVDDVVLTEGDKATVAVVSVGGFLGIGSKLVAIPFDQLKRDGDKAVLAGATKDTLNAMPGLIY